MKKQLLFGIFAMVFTGIYMPTALAGSFSSIAEQTYAVSTNPPSHTNGTINIPGNNYPNNTSANGTVVLKPSIDNNVTHNKTIISKEKLKPNRHKFHSNRQHKVHVKQKHKFIKPISEFKIKPLRPNNRKPKPIRPVIIGKPAGPAHRIPKPNNPVVIDKPVRPDNRVQKPNNPVIIDRPTRPNNGIQKPTNTNQTPSRTQVHGPHWCYGACSLHDAGLHNAPRNVKHWCDGYR